MTPPKIIICSYNTIDHTYKSIQRDAEQNVAEFARV